MSIVVLLLVCCGVSLRAVAQQPRQVKVSEINVSDIATIEGRVFVMHRILDKGYYCFKNANASNTIDVYVPVDEKDELSDFDFFYDNIINELLDEFYYLDKSTRGELFKQWGPELGNEVFEVILEDFTKGLREGNLRADNITCEDALPFCSNEEQFIFYPNVDAGNLCGGYCGPPYNDCPNANFYHSYADGTWGDYYDGIARAPDPAFYFMQVGQSGNLDIHIVGTTSTGGALDVDFVCWGPFNSIHDICNLSCDNMVDASYHASSDEHCYINNAQAGQYYTLLLTNYSDETGYYTFTTTGSGTTNCDIMPPVVDNNGPYCVGETIELTAMALEGTATYSWSGPNGWTSNQQNPTRPNCTLNMAGTYTCTITYNGQTSSASTVVEIFSSPVANFNISQATVCRGTSVTFTDASYNPSPGTIIEWMWDFGDGLMSTLQNPTHIYGTIGTYNVTLTVGNGGCTSTVTKTINVVDGEHYDVFATTCDSYTWNGTTYTQSGDYTVVFPGDGGNSPDPCNPNSPFNNSFEGGLVWTTIDADGDGHAWFARNSSTYGMNAAHSGNGWACSESVYYNGSGYSSLTPDNYLVSPRTRMTANQHTVSFWASAQDLEYPAEHFGVAVSTTSSINPNAFTLIQDWSLTRDGTRGIGRWYHYTVDLSAYIGQQIYVAIRHYNCSDEFVLNVDDIKLICTGEDSAPCDYNTPLYNDFEGFLELGNWTTIDADGDGYDWFALDYLEDNLNYNAAYSGSGWATSVSGLYIEVPLTPDNYLISPRTQITTYQHTLSFWAKAQDPAYPYEHFGVFVSTTNNTSPNAFSLIPNQQWTLNDGDWHHYTVDLSAYIGQQIYVAFRHFNCTGQFRLNIDRVELLCTDVAPVPVSTACDSIVTLHLTVVPPLDVSITVDGDTTLCAGDTVTMHAVVDSLHLNYLAPGDIICMDDTIVKPHDWPVQGKTAKAVVFYVDNTRAHGWAVSLTQSNSVKWSTNTNNTLVVSTNNNTVWREAIRDMNGQANTTAIRAAGSSTTYQAAWWYPANLGTGWYLPSIGQLNVLFGELVAVNASLRIVGGTQIRDNGGVTEANGNVLLWSSTEKSASSAYALEVRDGQIGGINKASTTNKQYVRAIIDF